MRLSLIVAALAFAAQYAAALPVLAGPVPTPKVGECRLEKITLLGSRLEGVPDSGVFVRYGPMVVDGVEYDMVPALSRAKVGDKVELCLVSVPKGCPPGDNRGKVWLAVDLRTQEFWQLPDAEHMCGGA